MAKKQWILSVTKMSSSKNAIFFQIISNQKDPDLYPSLIIDWDKEARKPIKDIQVDLKTLFNDHKEFPTFELVFISKDAFSGKNPANASTSKYLEKCLKIKKNEIKFFENELMRLVHEY